MSIDDVKPGSVWSGSDERKFIVIQLVETDGHNWVHYRNYVGTKDKIEECNEFSCYVESFVERFRKTVD